jgi:flagellar protein FliO/FliZ
VETLFLVLRVAVSLGVVLAVIWWAHRRITASRTRTRRTELVTVVARQAVAPKASVVVVDADGRRLTLGVTEHGVSVLHDREAPEVELVGHVASASEPIETPRAALKAGSPGLDTRSTSAPATRPADAFEAILATTSSPTRSAAPSAPTSPATHGLRRGSILSAETWKRSFAGVKEGLGI